jgi:hypothetical protein
VIGAARQAASPSPVAKIVLTAVFFLVAGPLIAGLVTIPIIWYFSIDGMDAGQAVGSGVVVTLLGFWAIIPVGAISALGVGLTVGWLDVMRRMTSIWIAAVAGLVFGAVWGMVLQFNISEFAAVAPAVTVGSVVASTACWTVVRWARAARAGGRA